MGKLGNEQAYLFVYILSTIQLANALFILYILLISRIKK